MKLKDLSIQDLVAYEKATKLICARYENDIRALEMQGNSDRALYEEFNNYHVKYVDIVEEMKQRVMDLKTNENKG